MTLRRLVDMADAATCAAWHHTAALLATIEAAASGKSVNPLDRHPHFAKAEPEEPTAAPVTRENRDTYRAAFCRC